MVWHSRLTAELRDSLRVILGDHYTNYAEALQTFELKSLFERREDRYLSFTKSVSLFTPDYSQPIELTCRERFSDNFKIQIKNAECEILITLVDYCEC